MNETEIIGSLLTKITDKEYLKNDAFVLDNFVITKDVLVEGIHFFTGSDPKKLAKKALRVNLSDIASMGARPVGYFLGIVLNNETKKQSWLESFASGLAEDHEKYKIKLFGGDTVIHSGPLIISITMIGEKNGKVMTRSGARPGDIICVSGNIGDSYLGLLSYQGKIEDNPYFKEKYDMPDPKIKLGIEISEFATSCIDISDGLVHDANHIAKNSSVMLEINIDLVPFSREARSISGFNLDMRKNMITAGDDYELLFTVPKCSGNLLKIGIVKEGLGVKVIDNQNNIINLERSGFVHK